MQEAAQSLSISNAEAMASQGVRLASPDRHVRRWVTITRNVCEYAATDRVTLGFR